MTMSEVPAQEERLVRHAVRRRKKRRIRQSPLKRWKASIKWGVFYFVGFAIIVATAYWVVKNASQPPPTGIHSDG